MLAEEASPEVVTALRAQLEAEGQLLDEPDAFASAATLFHALLVERTGNITLTILAELFVEIVDRHHHETFARAVGFERSTRTRPTSTTATWSTSSSAAKPRRPRRSGASTSKAPPSAPCATSARRPSSTCSPDAFA